jgi:membrane protein required for colicin V production
MTALDAILLLLVVGGAVRGAMRGFTFEVMTLLSWLFGVVGLRLFHGSATQFLETIVGTGGGAAVLAFGVVFGGIFAISRFVGQRLGISIRQSLIGPIDRLLGFGFGGLKGLIAITLLFLLANLSMDVAYGGDSERPDWMRDSRAYPLLNASGRAIVDFVEMRRDEENEASVQN